MYTCKSFIKFTLGVTFLRVFSWGKSRPLVLNARENQFPMEHSHIQSCKVNLSDDELSCLIFNFFYLIHLYTIFRWTLKQKDRVKFWLFMVKRKPEIMTALSQGLQWKKMIHPLLISKQSHPMARFEFKLYHVCLGLGL